jgi:hypothetical protein
MRQSPDHSATPVSAQTRAEGCSDVEFRRISLQGIARRSVHSVSTETASRKLTSAYIAALKPNASVCDISDPAVPGLVLRVAISGSKAWLFRFKWDGTPHPNHPRQVGRLGVTPFIGERVINPSKDVLEETYDLWDYFDEKRDALERFEIISCSSETMKLRMFPAKDQVPPTRPRSQTQARLRVGLASRSRERSSTGRRHGHS